MSLGYTVNRDKNGILLAYIASRIPNITLRKLIKLVYITDEKFTLERGFPLTWFDYFAWKKGPVAQEIYDIKNGTFSEYVNCYRDKNNKCIITPILKVDIQSKLDLYSEYEMNIIDNIISIYGNKSADDLTDITHFNNSLWTQIVNENNIDFSISGHSNIKIPLSRLNQGDSDKEEIFKEAFEYMLFCNA